MYYNGFHHPKMKSLMERYCMPNNLYHNLLSISFDYKHCLLELGIDKADLPKNKFSTGEFEFFLTDRKGDDKKYYLSAFYRKEELDRGIELLNRGESTSKTK